MYLPLHMVFNGIQEVAPAVTLFRWLLFYTQGVPSTYYEPGNVLKGGREGTVIDSILQWFADLFAQIGMIHMFNDVGWGVYSGHSLFNKGHVIDENKHQMWQFILSLVHAANQILERNAHMSLFISLLVFLGPWILMLPLLLFQLVFYAVLILLGFTMSGVRGGSLAASFQSMCYGAHTPSASLFAMLQSAGTHYNAATIPTWFLLLVRLAAGAVAAYVLVTFILGR